MKANPGGAVSPENVMGRDHLIDRLWATLKHQSLVLVAERRTGKTCIIKKMEAQPPDGIMITWGKPPALPGDSQRFDLCGSRICRAAQRTLMLVADRYSCH